MVEWLNGWVDSLRQNHPQVGSPIPKVGLECLRPTHHSPLGVSRQTETEMGCGKSRWNHFMLYHAPLASKLRSGIKE